jgi:hypothetical protein
MKLPGAWQFSGDVDWIGHGGKWIRQVETLAFQVIEFTNMDDACGRDNEGRPPYHCDLSLVDLETIGPKEIGHALGYVGVESDEKIAPIWIADACHAYGCKAPLWQDAGRNAHELVREAKREAKAYLPGSDALVSAMDRPVNALGSTAREYMTGDLDSATARGLESGDPAASLIAKMLKVCLMDCPACIGKGEIALASGAHAACSTCRGKGKGVRTLGGFEPAPDYVKV